MSRLLIALPLVLLALEANAFADVGDPQIRTDHAWYPGELACSTFERLQATQADLYERVVGRQPTTDHDKALAAWLWRNAHYAHGEEGAEDLWGEGFTRGGDVRSREYWTGLFAHGFGLCGTTHSQWTAEFNALLGHNRGRGVGVKGHNTFEAFLRGGQYGEGKWVLLDHDQSTVIFNEGGTALLSMAEIQPDWQRLATRDHRPERQNGWLVCGLHPGDGGTYADYTTAEYLAGYSGVPPIVHLRRGETLRRYLQPGLADGKTFVFWGRNYQTGGIPGPERSHTWINQPEKMFGSTEGAGYKPGQARYANAEYVYRPNFADGTYREAVVAETEQQIAFEFYTPYIIAATPAGPGPWDIYAPGCTNGLVLQGKANCDVSVSVDQGATWLAGGKLTNRLDLTDLVKGHRQYLLRFEAGREKLAGSGLTITTVCQANATILPRLKSGGSEIRFESSGRAVVSAGPNLPQAQAHVVAGAFGSPTVTLQLESPRGEPAVAIHAAAHVRSGNPPDPKTEYFIEVSTDEGKTWQPIVEDWHISRRGDEPADFWSQSMCYGSAKLEGAQVRQVQVRFRNSGGRAYARAEAHLVYRTAGADATRVTFAWTDERGPQRQSHDFAAQGAAPWKLATGEQAKTEWVEFEPVAAR
ncbi:MAG: hypothetical protein WD872_18120 [Pirellulaceae bacterium]